MGSEIHTGYLLSSNPRIQDHSSLSWAPSCPTVRLQPDTGMTDKNFFLSFDGTDTQRGAITPDGLLAKWHVYKFPCAPTGQNTHLDEISSRYLENFHFGALLLPLPNQGPRIIPARYRGNVEGNLLAVCGSNDDRRWTWAGVYDWRASRSLPLMKVENILLV